MIEQDYQIAIDSSGMPYLDAEQRLIGQGDAAVQFLQGKLSQSAPLARRIIQVLLEWLAENETFSAVMDYFQRVEKRAAATAMQVPPADGVANYLVQNFGTNAAELLGVYLLKLFPIWPRWQTGGVILYFSKLDASSAAEPLIEFIATTPDNNFRQMAVSSLVAIGDASALAKIEARLTPLLAGSGALQEAAEKIKAKTNNRA